MPTTFIQNLLGITVKWRASANKVSKFLTFFWGLPLFLYFSIDGKHYWPLVYSRNSENRLGEVAEWGVFDCRGPQGWCCLVIVSDTETHSYVLLGVMFPVCLVHRSMLFSFCILQGKSLTNMNSAHYDRLMGAKELTCDTEVTSFYGRREVFFDLLRAN